MLRSPVLLILLGLFVGCAPLGRYSPLLPIERGLVFQPESYPHGDWHPVGLNFEEARFEAEDGTKLHGWCLPHERPRGIALFCHGNAGNITGLASSLQVLRDRHGLTAMTFDYRGYGRSAGQPSEEGILQDARAARRWLAARAGVAERDIILMGQSLGGAVAIDLAAQDGARGLVIASTFTSLPDVGVDHMPWLLPRWNMTMRLDSLSKIKHYRGPLLISHGDADETIPIAHGEKLYEAAPGPKRFLREPGLGHNDPRSEEYRVALEEFLGSLAPFRREGTWHGFPEGRPGFLSESSEPVSVSSRSGSELKHASRARQ
jgi:pimeloyl-ACP methyl ester carboxylesterase